MMKRFYNKRHCRMYRQKQMVKRKKSNMDDEESDEEISDDDAENDRHGPNQHQGSSSQFK